MLLRAGLWFLAIVTVAVGVVATFLPRAFYQGVPWVALDPPYSEHLMRDFGAMNLALALVLVVAGVTSRNDHLFGDRRRPGLRPPELE